MERASPASRERSGRDYGEVAKRSNAADCKSVALAASKVRILPSPPTFARALAAARGFGWQARCVSEWRESRAALSEVRRARRRACQPKRERVGSERRACPPKRARAKRAEREGGSNSVVESQPSKLLVAGSIPVSRSSLRRAFAALTASAGKPAPSVRVAASRASLAAERSGASERTADLSAEAREGGEGRCSSVGRARPW